MIKLAVLSIVVWGSISAFGAPKKVVTCDSLKEKAEQNCEEAICEDSEGEGSECIRDGDFMVILQECAYEEFNSLLEKHNRNKTKSKKLVCEDY